MKIQVGSKFKDLFRLHVSPLVCGNYSYGTSCLPPQPFPQKKTYLIYLVFLHWQRSLLQVLTLSQESSILNMYTLYIYITYLAHKESPLF